MILFRPVLWGIRRLGVATFLSLLLLLIAFASLISALADHIREFDTALAAPVVVLGLLGGWLLARLPLPAWLAGLVAAILSLEAIVIRIGRLDKLLIDILKPLPYLLWDIWQWPFSGPPDFLPLQTALLALGGGLNILAGRVVTWLGPLLTGGEATFDPVAAALTWNLILAGVAVWAGWVVRRQGHPFLALAPAGTLLATVLAYSSEWPTAIVTFLTMTLLLMILVKHYLREGRWERAGIGYSPEIRIDLALTAVPIAAGLVAVAVLLSTISIRGITNFIQNMFAYRAPAGIEAMADSLGVAKGAGAGTPLDPIRFGGLPRDHLIGSGPELSEQIVMVIETNDPPFTAGTPPSYYWRSITYDRYTGRGWATANSQRIDYEAEAVTVAEIPERRRVLQQRVQGYDFFNGLLHVAGEVVTVDQPYAVDWRGPEDIFGGTIAGNSYRARSHLAAYSEAQLQQAGTAYPDWVKARYLNLPDSLPNRVRSLARDLTATAPTPYDRAKAIESYLRTIPYSLDLPAPPPERDIADYFLFELKKGYCDYYATAMVALARAAGLPARLAVGYINGTYNAEDNLFVVSEADAHSWVEIYFPEFGWVNFEPTGGRPGIERGGPSQVPYELTEESSPWDFAGPLSPGLLESGSGGILPRWSTSLAGLILLAGLGLGLWSLVDRWRLQRLAPAATIAALHQRLTNHGRGLKTPAALSDTPYEFATLLTTRLAGLASGKQWQRYLQPAGQEVQWLTHLYVRTLYSPHHFDGRDQSEAIRLWQQLRRRLWLARLVVFSQRQRPPT
jgi:transglutaminase-like putative cysteine protease